MDMAEETRNGILVLAPAGRLDSANAAAFEARLVEAVAAGRVGVVVDLARLTVLGPAGLRAFLVAARRARPVGGRILLAGLSPSVRQVFESSGFATLFVIHPTVEEAVKAAG